MYVFCDFDNFLIFGIEAITLNVHNVFLFYGFLEEKKRGSILNKLNWFFNLIWLIDIVGWLN